MTAQYQPNVGEFCHEQALRDCIHVPLAPLVTAEEMVPGECFATDGKTAYPVADDDPKAVGIIDPFLRRKMKTIPKGSTVWGWIFPGTVTGLRHQWLHSAFASKPKEKT